MLIMAWCLQQEVLPTIITVRHLENGLLSRVSLPFLTMPIASS
jgi:hypothetical protein